MKETTISRFGWGVEDVLDEDGNLTARVLHITVLAQLPLAGPDGEPLAIPVEVLHLPFGTLDSGRASWENLSMAMRGEEPPPTVDVVKPGAMLGHRGPNGVPRG